MLNRPISSIVEDVGHRCSEPPPACCLEATPVQPLPRGTSYFLLFQNRDDDLDRSWESGAKMVDGLAEC